MAKQPKKVVYRSSVDGHFVTKKYAQNHPRITERQHVPIVKPKKKRK
jgi:hypothetical protein